MLSCGLGGGRVTPKMTPAGREKGGGGEEEEQEKGSKGKEEK